MIEEQPSTRSRRQRWRAGAAVVLVILACLGVVLSTVSVWVRNTVFDTEAFMEIVEPSLTSPETVAVLSDAIADQVVVALDVGNRLEEQLSGIDNYLTDSLAGILDLSPEAVRRLQRADLPGLSDLAAPVGASIEDGIAKSVTRLVESDEFQTTLPSAVAYAHRGVVALIHNDDPPLENVTITEGEVRLNILPAVWQGIVYVLGQAESERVPLSGTTYADKREEAVAALAAQLGAALPEDFGQMTIMTADRLADWRSASRTLDRSATLLVVVTVALVGTALVVSPRRRRTLAQLGLGSVVAFLIASLVETRALEALNGAIPGVAERAAAQVFFDAALTSLRRISWTFVAVAATVGVGAHLSGRPRWMTSIGKNAASVSRPFQLFVDAHHDRFVAAGIAFAIAALWFVGLTAVSVLAVSLVLSLYLWYLLNISGDEAPDPTPHPTE